jgi:Transposase DDE domain
LKKSGKKTAGKDYFFNSIAGKAEKGLEISVISIVEVETRLAYTLSVQQTPKRPELGGVSEPRTIKAKPTRIPRHKNSLYPSQKPELTRIDDYIQHLKNTRPFLPNSVRYLVADGYYYRFKFSQAVQELNLEFIGKLRTDANLRYLYTGEQKKRGAPRKYDGKVDLKDLSRFTFVKQIEPGLSLYTQVVWSCCLKCPIRLVYLSDTRSPHSPKFALLFSTDIHLNAEQIFEYYQARFQIEFIFRDAKQFTGLSDCQSPHPQRLDFHFNASLTALNLAKYQSYHSHSSSQPFVFSMASYKRLQLNRHLLFTFISKFDLDPNLILNHPNFPSALSSGTLAA